MNHGPTCAVGREGVSCAGNTLAQTGQLKRGLFHRKLAFLIFFLWDRSNGFKCYRLEKKSQKLLSKAAFLFM